MDRLELEVAFAARKLLAAFRLLHLLRLVFVGDVLPQIFLGGSQEAAVRAFDGLWEMRQHVIDEMSFGVSTVAAQVAEEVFDFLVHDVDVLPQAGLHLAAKRTNSAVPEEN